MKHLPLWKLLLNNFFLVLGFQIWRTLINNFSVEELSVDPARIGILQSVREIPGLLGFLAVFLAFLIPHVRILTLTLLMMGGGLLLCGVSADYPSLVAGTLFMSFGFHYFGTSNQSIILLGSGERTGTILGKVRSAQSVASVAGAGAVFILVPFLGLRGMYEAAGLVVILGALVFAERGTDGTGSLEKKGIVFRRRYWLYYALTFLNGSRRHIFTTFAIYLLVFEFSLTAATISLLFLINNLLNIYALRKFGVLIDRVGERIVLAGNFFLLIWVFLGYAFIRYLPLLFLLFFIDELLFGFSMAVQSYLRKIAAPDEVSGQVSLGMTLNHVAALVIPVAGGYLWKAYGYHVPFLIGVAIALITFVLALFMREGAGGGGSPEGSEAVL